MSSPYPCASFCSMLWNSLSQNVRSGPSPSPAAAEKHQLFCGSILLWQHKKNLQRKSPSHVQHISIKKCGEPKEQSIPCSQYIAVESHCTSQHPHRPDQQQPEIDNSHPQPSTSPPSFSHAAVHSQIDVPAPPASWTSWTKKFMN